MWPHPHRQECFFEPIAAEAEAKGYRQVFLASEPRKQGTDDQLPGAGHRYYNQGRDLWTVLPLASWTAKDVFAYHVANGLPWAPIYDRTFLHPERSASGKAGGPLVRRHIVTEWGMAGIIIRSCGDGPWRHGHISGQEYKGG